ncbi:protein kinase [Streptomyces sp. NPDC087903]|uniref:protein kinase domain-containing protein n=1 Tax=Streptomyces sp. NPDC087903 TaxID=3365819 RepID=UPI003806D9BE
MNDGDSGRRVVDGRFELVARLGGGGMGTVWRAHDLALRRDVAVKEVRPPDADHFDRDPDAARMLRERVLREARALARIEHPNVVTIHHIVDGGDGTYPWIVMELVDGGSLADRLARGPMTPAAAARLGAEVLEALRAAHRAGVQHRDVKPANVLLRADGRPVLTDFGIAAIRESTALTATGSIIGTPDYMAPERISGDGSPAGDGAAADLWSLAMMLYVAVENHHPLRRATTLATLAAVLHDDVPPPSRAGVLTPVLNRVLVRDPAARPDAEALARMLETAAREGVDPRPTSYSLAPPAGAPATGPSLPTTWPAATPSAAPSDAAPSGPYPYVAPSPESREGVPSGPYPYAAGSPESRDGLPSGPYPYAAPSPGPSDAVPFAPHPHAAPSPGSGRPTRSVSAPARRPGPRRVAVLAAVLGAVLAGGGIWKVLPGSGQDDAAGSPGTSLETHRAATTPAADNGTPSADGEASTAGDLLTPAGVREALRAIEKETGRSSFGAFLVYPDYVSASVMVKGSQTRYDSYTYRVGQGVEKGIIKGSLAGGQKPVRLDDFRWDALPGLLKRAEKELKVDKPTTRYLLVRQPNDIFDTAAGMAVYISDEYGEGGYMEADRQGRVTRTVSSG